MVDLGHIATLLVLTVTTMAACVFASGDAWHAEILPLLVFAMTVAIAYDEDLALLLVAEVALVLVVGLGQGLADYITLTAAAAATIFWMGRGGENQRRHMEMLVCIFHIILPLGHFH